MRFQHGDRAWGRGDREGALRWWAFCARQGEPPAAWRLGLVLYLNARGPSQIRKALFWMEKGKSAGNLEVLRVAHLGTYTHIGG